LVISYYQPRQALREGVLVVDGAIFRTTGRLDAIGSAVFAWGFRQDSAEHGTLSMAVQCTRTGERSLAVEITVFGAGGTIVAKHCSKDVPLVIH
jgi:hypothetical protein